MPEQPPRFDPAGRKLVYVQIADDIAAKIASGSYQAEQRLPSLSDLAEEYGAARMTARRAVRELLERGLVEVVPGKGTFVLARPR
jgi:GntR family transcriptional regulator